MGFPKWKLNWKAHLDAVGRKLKTQSYALSRIAAKTWGLGLAKAREVYSNCGMHHSSAGTAISE